MCIKMAAVTKHKLFVVCVCICCHIHTSHCGTEQFVQPIFQKYGENGIMSLEGLGRLMLNIGLGRVNQTNTNETKMHDIKQKSRDNLEQQQKDSKKDLTNSCLSPAEILRLPNEDSKNVEGIHINQKLYQDLCSILLYQLDQKCYTDIRTITKSNKSDRNSSNSDFKQIHQQGVGHNEDKNAAGSNWHLAWLYASLSVLIISASGIIGIAVVPFARNASYPQLLRFLVALAVGTLCGDALLHLLPHSLIPHEHGHQNNENEVPHQSIHEESGSHTLPMYKCGVCFLTIVIFYTLESILPIFNKNMHGHTHHHGHTHEINKPEMGSMLTGHQHEHHSHRTNLSPIALMVLLGDGLHNLTDGLAIGAAFSNDPVTGVATAIAILCHELPHELGDFAVLLRAGFSVRRVLFFNLVSSIISFVGMAIGLVVANGHAAASQWIYAATAGSFLYIALADLIPEMSQHGEKRVGHVLLQVAGILLGGGIMFVIALHEDSLRSLFS